MSIEDGRFFFGSMSKLAIALRLPEMDGWLGAYRGLARRQPPRKP